MDVFSHSIPTFLRLDHLQIWILDDPRQWWPRRWPRHEKWDWEISSPTCPDSGYEKIHISEKITVVSNKLIEASEPEKRYWKNQHKIHCRILYNVSKMMMMMAFWAWALLTLALVESRGKSKQLSSGSNVAFPLKQVLIASASTKKPLICYVQAISVGYMVHDRY